MSEGEGHGQGPVEDDVELESWSTLPCSVPRRLGILKRLDSFFRPQDVLLRGASLSQDYHTENSVGDRGQDLLDLRTHLTNRPPTTAITTSNIPTPLYQHLGSGSRCPRVRIGSGRAVERTPHELHSA